MTTIADIANRGLQNIGTRTTVTAAELLANSTNEAIQVNLCLENIRDGLIRMAPWDCALKTANLQYITSSPGTPENTSAATTLWQPGQPAPPWAYEYQYPPDCMRACWMIPANQTGYAGGVPITTAVTGGAPSFWQGPPVKFKVQTDEFWTVIDAVVAAGGSGYVVNEVITLDIGPNTSPPIGGPAQLRVLTVSGGAVLTVEPVNILNGAEVLASGSYFTNSGNPGTQASSTGVGTGVTFNLAYSAAKASQRVILTNQEFATLVYCKQVTDPNVMDTMFQSAWSSIIGATVCMALTGDKKAANMMIQDANIDIMEARKVDGNEGLTINDITPDWIRIRGVDFPNAPSGPYSGGFEWGGLWGQY